MSDYGDQEPSRIPTDTGGLQDWSKRSLQTARNLRPRHTKTLFGRQEDLAKIENLLLVGNQQLVSIVGMGGAGKTSVAVAVFNQPELDSRFNRKVFINLEGLSEPERLATMIAEAMGISLLAEDHWQTIAQNIPSTDSLVVLDNLEHIIADVRNDLITLLNSCPHLVILATTRSLLHIPGEVVYELEGLNVPLDSQATFEDYAATQLFIKKAQRLNNHFDYHLHREAILRICQYLQGWPLGIELAASWVRHQTASGIAQHLQEDLDSLGSKSRRITTRHASARTVIDHSWQLLTPAEQEALTSLAVFQSGFSAEAAQNVCQVTPECLTSLASHSLLTVNEDQYNWHVVIYDYSLEKLQGLEQHTQLREQHALYYLDLAEQASEALHGKEQDSWFDRLAAEHHNLLAALTYFENKPSVVEGLNLAVDLAWFCDVRGHYQESIAWLKRLREQLPDGHPTLLAEAIYQEGHLTWRQGNLEQAENLFRQSLALHSDQYRQAKLHNNLGLIAHDQGDTNTAQQHFETSLALNTALEYQPGMADSLNHMGIIADTRGDLDEAKQLYLESLQLRRQVGDKRMVAFPLNSLGNLAFHQKDYSEAVQHYQESLIIHEELSDQEGIAYDLAHVATLLEVTDHADPAVILAATSDQLCKHIHISLSPYLAARLEQSMQRLQESLTKAHYSLLWTTGQALPAEDALALANAELRRLSS